MSFLLNRRRVDNFARELNFDQLLAVNGGCGGSFSGDSGYTGGSGENHGYNSYGSGGSGSSSSGSGSCSGTGSYNSGSSSSSSSGTCSGGTSSLTHQTPDDPNDFHCDINSYNVAVDQGIKNPGSWDGNILGVNAIYTEYYSKGSTQTPEEGTRGYGFYDNDGNGTYDHMYFYDYRTGGSSYTVWNSDGKTTLTKQTWSINGTAVSHSVYVPLT